MKKWNRAKADAVTVHVVLVLIGIAFVVPLLWMIFAAFDGDATLALQVPQHWTLGNFWAILSDPANQRAFVNGVIISLGQSILVVIVAGLAAYPLSRYHLKYKRPFMYTILFSTSLPITAVMVPVYELFVFLHITDSIFWTTLFLAASGLPYAIWIMKNFMDSVPIELEEAAWTDGASAFSSLRKIVAPLMLPGISTVGIFTFAGSWGNFFVPFILIQTPSKLPASVTIFQFFGQYGSVEYGKLAAFSILYTIPAVVLYVLGQRYMSTGFQFGGATKG
ncbi:binding-protein-dependent transport systems inner membrane component [Alicyclobacillus hesperidum URH17-3-68]|uniref:Sugar ABC transporter permease n=1 Tax=Alicyclobacillus hesperidum TaxID=89784 RepID=A0AA37X4E3_9BACL|nr:carbohydrate ABC transporter permease [Alicyclobacillus hesperidum]EJY54804.1 binding-protein-dependent transport systems inner membrane component [Alicyclobacillus hesperidum URH17-3-68]GLV14842.1 sugar ABC transporter permease [Alicyclobacillus hesperidum]